MIALVSLIAALLYVTFLVFKAWRARRQVSPPVCHWCYIRLLMLLLLATATQAAARQPTCRRRTTS